MAEALDSPRRKALFEQMNREEMAERVESARSMSPGERIEAAMRLNEVAFEFARELKRSSAVGSA